MTVIWQNKPHPLSKEWRALREAQKAANAVETFDSKPQEVSTPTNPDYKALLERMERQEREIQELKDGKSNPFSSAKERYKWPYHYSYTLRGNIPVISRKTVKMDVTKDLQFKNQYWVWESNHALELELANGETTKVEITLYNRDKQKTQPMPCTVMTNEDWEKMFVFKNEQYWDLKILLPYVN